MLERAVDLDQFGLLRIIATEILVVLGVFTAVPDVAVGRLREPVVGVLDQQAVLVGDDVVDHDAVDAGDPLGRGQHRDDDGLVLALEHPLVAHRERPVGIGVVEDVGEESTPESGVVAALPGGLAVLEPELLDLVALVEGLGTLLFGLVVAVAALLGVADVGADGARLVVVVAGVEAAGLASLAGGALAGAGSLGGRGGDGHQQRQDEAGDERSRSHRCGSDDHLCGDSGHLGILSLSYVNLGGATDALASSGWMSAPCESFAVRSAQLRFDGAKVRP